jgi:hypothetical protein
VDAKGNVIERFLALVHVIDTTTDSLNEALFAVLDKHNLSISQIQEQGYYGARI